MNIAYTPPESDIPSDEELSPQRNHPYLKRCFVCWATPQSLFMLYVLTTSGMGSAFSTFIGMGILLIPFSLLFALFPKKNYILNAFLSALGTFVALLLLGFYMMYYFPRQD